MCEEWTAISCYWFNCHCFKFSQLRMILLVDLSHITFSMLRCVLFSCILPWIFTWRNTEFCQKILLHDLFTWLCVLLNLYYIYWFAYVEPSLHFRVKVNLVMVYNPFDVCLHSVGIYFIEYFKIYIHHEYWPISIFKFTYLFICSLIIVLSSYCPGAWKALLQET